ncbi:GTPase HflX [Streptococcus caviae]|uniref:GTPase HflX n=1 Tax=Streptococcus sp. 'caviae' TaxID=1915004 RepID=UPI00094B85BD|nr:GTPase HflX [Streptococcus sp. 'caviae']OLN84272.1 GTPase HflX [Streptococcus sp. 'caviae']
MIETSQKQERVILVGVELPDSDNFEMSMKELASLAQTAGAEVIHSYSQKRDRYDSKSFIGSGKLQEMKRFIETDAADTVIVNNQLTPRQNTYLEAELGLKVIDRMQLILDIFAMRARSHEGKLQVHLAQLKYMLPRLVGQGVMLSRQAGGIGSRGPGESQLELNRRSIRRQIADVERQLKAVAKNRETNREKRLDSEIFKIGLIGYTNAGKSTIMNMLTDKSQYEANELFATLDATTKQIYLFDCFQATLTDTVGFIQDLPTELVAAFKSTLEESRQVDLLLHIIDASDPNHEDHEQVVLDILSELGMSAIPRLVVYNKMDKVTNFAASQYPYVSLSAKSQEGALILRQAIVEKIKTMFVPFTLKINQENAYKLYDLSRIALLDSYDVDRDGQEITGYIAEKNKWRLEPFYVELS